MPKIGKKLKKIRESIGLTLEDAAKLAGFKHFQTLSKILGKSNFGSIIPV